jgi:hypothetical protein
MKLEFHNNPPMDILELDYYPLDVLKALWAKDPGDRLYIERLIKFIEQGEEKE